MSTTNLLLALILASLLSSRESDSLRDATLSALTELENERREQLSAILEDQEGAPSMARKEAAPSMAPLLGEEKNNSEISDDIVGSNPPAPPTSIEEKINE